METINLQQNKQPFLVICINDADKPLSIPSEEWILEGNSYIVTEVFKDLFTNDLSFKLLDKNPEPYKGYNSKRFGILPFSAN
jgi:hypothetical protein